jgi:hypothetical protein
MIANKWHLIEAPFIFFCSHLAAWHLLIQGLLALLDIPNDA